MAAVLNILSPAHRQRRRGPELTLHIPDLESPTHKAATVPKTAPVAKTPNRLRNRLRKRLRGLRTAVTPTFEPERGIDGQQPGFSACESQAFLPTTPRGSLGGFRGFGQSDDAVAKKDNGRAVGNAEHQGHVSAGAQQEAFDNWHLSFTAAIIPSFWTTVSQDDLAYRHQSIAFEARGQTLESDDELGLSDDEKGQSLLMDYNAQHIAADNNNAHIHPAFRDSAIISNPDSTPTIKPSHSRGPANPLIIRDSPLDPPPDFDMASDSSSTLQLPRSKLDNRSGSTSSSLYSTRCPTSPATSVSENASPSSAGTETENVDVPALIQSAERLAAEYRTLLLSRRGTPVHADMSTRAASELSTTRNLGCGQRIVRKVKSFHSLRKIVKGAEREIERARARTDHGTPTGETILEERFSFAEGDDAEYMPTSRFSDAATLVAIMDEDYEAGAQDLLKEDDQCEKWAGDDLLEDLGFPADEENLEVPPRHPGRLTRVWTSAMLAAPAEPDAPRCYCSRRRPVGSGARASGDLPSRVVVRLDEVSFQAFCDGCRRNVVWMADAAEIRALRTKDEEATRDHCHGNDGGGGTVNTRGA